MAHVKSFFGVVVRVPFPNPIIHYIYIYICIHHDVEHLICLAGSSLCTRCRDAPQPRPCFTIFQALGLGFRV